ncbi:MAG: hypothetical protein ACFFDF_00415 [Candidatus Odinarchaeota archaeon]
MKWKDDQEPQNTQNQNTPDEKKLLNWVIKNQQNAEGVRGSEYSTYENYYNRGIEQIWEDEAKMFIGNQWDTSIAYRTKETRKKRPNSVDNFIFPAVMNLHANITVSTPEVNIEPTSDNDKEIADKLTYMSRYNDGVHRNNFRALWKKMVLPFIAYGPIIGAVLWDDEWMGGTGPNRWIGDVRILNIDRRYIYFDPAVIELEERLQECSFINRKFRKKLSYLKKSYPDKKLTSDNNDMELQDEGMDPEQVWLIESWHRGKPKFVPNEARKEFIRLSQKAKDEGDDFKAKDYMSMANGTLEGVHCAYVANNVLLEYQPYKYEDGLYPFVYKTCYYDENTQHGFGEIRNIVTPQLMHNKADEIEIEAMSRQGLGGKYYRKGSVTSKQKEEILKNSGKGGSWLEVDDIHGLEDREGVQVPNSSINYKEQKQRMVETISQNTPIQQGMSPGANVPYKAIAELGARTDVRTKAKVEILEDFLVEINRLRINRFVQFYTDERYYRLKGERGEIISGTFSNKEMYQEWEREEEGQTKKEKFIPEFDINIKIMDEKPTDRNYYTSTGFEMFKLQGMTMEDLWYTLDEGKFPNRSEVLDNLKTRDISMQIADSLKNLSPEQQQQVIQMQQQLIQQMQSQEQPGNIDEFLDSLPDEEIAKIQQMPPDEQQAYIQQLMAQTPT